MKKYDSVDEYLAAAPRWRDEMALLRKTLLGSGLEEAVKWGKPCFSHGEQNIVILQPMKNFLAVMFFQGALLDDPAGLLQEQGENTRSARRLCLTSVAQVRKHQAAVRALVKQAIRVESEGKRLPAPPPLVLVDELKARLKRDRKLDAAFKKLTPGRQREYHLYVSGAKQSKTREARVEKQVARILAGKGLRDR